MFTFVYDVLVPEVVVRLLMEAHSISYRDVSEILLRIPLLCFLLSRLRF